MRTSSIRERLGRLPGAATPALHFALLGTLLFLASRAWEPSVDTEAPIEKPRLVIPASRLADAEESFRIEQRREPTAAERHELIDTLVDEEILFRHAMDLGLHRAEVPQRRLAQIAAFVGSLESPAGPEVSFARVDPALAQHAVDLGLHEGDFVTRRVLVDAARRLIRGAARLVEPDEARIAEYLEAYGERFRREDRYRISHVLRSRSTRHDPARDATTLLARLRRDAISPQGAAGLGDPGIVPPSLPLLGRRALERRFGVELVNALASLPVGRWSGPVTSRHGAHLVFVHEVRPGEIPGPAEVGDQIRSLLREEAAERWLAERLRQLREGYEIELPEAPAVQGDLS